jgi:hypothetical protein
VGEVIHYVVVAGSPAAVDRLWPRLGPSLERTRFFEGERLERLGASRTWAAAAILAPDPTWRSRLAADDDAMIVVNGPALATGGDQARLADVVLERYRSGGSGAVSAALGGSYNFVGVAPAIGLRAFADFSGLFPLYWRQGPDFGVFSNRSTTVAALAGSGGWDLRALAWVIGHANLFGDSMPAQGVSYVPPGREARAEWGDGRVRLDTSSNWVWRPPSEDSGRDNLTAEEWDEVTDALVANFRALRAVGGGPLHLSITGGKDSRLCLALARSANLQDCLETFTSGPFDSPEVEVAATVAKAAGFRHTRRGPPREEADPAHTAPRPRRTEVDPGAQWLRLRQDVYRYEAAVSAWSGLANPCHPPLLNVKGFGGEFYRRGNAKQFRRKDMPSVDALASMFVNYHQVHDPLRILRRSEASFQVEWLKAWVHMTAKHVRLDLLPEKFYVDHRLSHWSGPLIQATPARINVNPLLLSSAARKNLELSPRARSNERFHFEVMRRAAPELVGIPFLNDVWADDIAKDPSVSLPRQPYSTSLKGTKRVLTRGHQGWPLLANESRAIARLFEEAARETEMGAICKLRRLKRIARNSAQLTQIGEVKELFSAIGAALVLLGRAEPVFDRPCADVA